VDRDLAGRHAKTSDGEVHRVLDDSGDLDRWRFRPALRLRRIDEAGSSDIRCERRRR
jgi:hypothetical protein